MKDTDRKDMPCSCIRRPNIVKMPIPSKVNYQFSVSNPYQNPNDIFTLIEKKS